MATLLNIKQANEIVGGLSTPSKMPGYCYSISPSRCKTGSKLRKVKGSVCEKCYAHKGNYSYPCVKDAHARRLEALSNPQWVEAMVFLINKRADKHPEFRWHDSGDIQSMKHLHMIIKVALNTPDVDHWLPTKEFKIVSKYLNAGGCFPNNLCVRVSMPMVGQKPEQRCRLNTSTVDSGKGFRCPVQNGSETCDTYKCRACWDLGVSNIDYRSH